jgi:hypothetical protein
MILDCRFETYLVGVANVSPSRGSVGSLREGGSRGSEDKKLVVLRRDGRG